MGVLQGRRKGKVGAEQVSNISHSTVICLFSKHFFLSSVLFSEFPILLYGCHVVFNLSEFDFDIHFCFLNFLFSPGLFCCLYVCWGLQVILNGFSTFLLFVGCHSYGQSVRTWLIDTLGGMGFHFSCTVPPPNTTFPERYGEMSWTLTYGMKGLGRTGQLANCPSCTLKAALTTVSGTLVQTWGVIISFNDISSSNSKYSESDAVIIHQCFHQVGQHDTQITLWSSLSSDISHCPMLQETLQEFPIYLSKTGNSLTHI